MQLLKFTLFSALAAAAPATTTVTTTYTETFTTFITNPSSTATSYTFPSSHSCFTTKTDGGEVVVKPREPEGPEEPVVFPRAVNAVTTTTTYVATTVTSILPATTTYEQSSHFKLSNGVFGSYAAQYKASKGNDFVFNSTIDKAAVWNLGSGAAGSCELTVGPAFKGVGIYPVANPGSVNSAPPANNLINCTVTDIEGYYALACSHFENPAQKNSVVCGSTPVWELSTGKQPSGCSAITVYATPAAA